ncbi:MAG: tripartite tricarboxylate transporter substrate binding protein, partial [Rhodospirillales bacterium]|nr:tripartite tricarboxylate transporter substrate binding protein [Rhodospirillales bacterium]
MIKKSGLAAAAFGAVAMAFSGGASAAFPEKDITFIIPYGPGGGFDTWKL